ncbi:hypothetical protein BLS_009728 [Venturia inaequalis]|uniref:Uncharacterized protein n=1 Tax=Venturia inaequalis TaxID=5025 RepID=A0A8H3V1W1_VENIN|nr:hypothetical protein BLS_009728 [Venturia inaequalis]KAE9984927.1 hypothetical protein EG328_008125 [Venturia inaequalis]RDI87969.1 hypothetical protein Vi05172_g1757 [Venturia inaequalis]
MTLKGWESKSASLALPQSEKPESPDSKREESAGHDTKGKSRDENNDNQVRAASHRSDLADIDTTANKVRASPKTQSQQISSRRPIQGLRDSFMEIPKMNKEDREEYREMAREWSYHDLEIKERIEQFVEEHEAGETREEEEAINLG